MNIEINPRAILREQIRGIDGRVASYTSTNGEIPREIDASTRNTVQRGS
jgi:hypothetical protein